MFFTLKALTTYYKSELFCGAGSSLVRASVKKAVMEVPMGLLRTNEFPPNPHAQPEQFQEHMSGKATTELVAEKQTPEEENLSLLQNSEGNLFLADGARLYRVLDFTFLGIEAKTLDTSEHKVYHLSNAAFIRLAAERDVLEKELTTAPAEG